MYYKLPGHRPLARWCGSGTTGDMWFGGSRRRWWSTRSRDLKCVVFFPFLSILLFLNAFTTASLCMLMPFEFLELPEATGFLVTKNNNNTFFFLLLHTEFEPNYISKIHSHVCLVFVPPSPSQQPPPPTALVCGLILSSTIILCLRTTTTCSGYTYHYEVCILCIIIMIVMTVILYAQYKHHARYYKLFVYKLQRRTIM